MVSKVLGLAACVLAGVAGLTGCQVPIDQSEQKEADRVEAQLDERPTQDELVNEVNTMAMLPANVSAAGLSEGVGPSVTSTFMQLMRDHSNVKIVAEPARANELVKQVVEGSSSMYSSETSVEIGNLAQAQYVAWAEVLNWAHQQEEQQEKRIADDGREVITTYWRVGAWAEVAIKIQKVETGEYVHTKVRRGRWETRTDNPPTAGNHQFAGEQAVMRALEFAAAEATGEFTYNGQIKQTREERDLWLCTFDGDVHMEKGTLVYAYRLVRDLQDPSQVTEMRVAAARVERFDSPNQVWCRESWGADAVRAKMFVRSAGLQED